jgi:hypothetical protein
MVDESVAVIGVGLGLVVMGVAVLRWFSVRRFLGRAGDDYRACS